MTSQREPTTQREAAVRALAEAVDGFGWPTGLGAPGGVLPVVLNARKAEAILTLLAANPKAKAALAAWLVPEGPAGGPFYEQPPTPARPTPSPAPSDGLRTALDEVAALIETGENRAMAADGPVPHFRGELDDREWRRLWLALSKVRSNLSAPVQGLDVERLRVAMIAYGMPTGVVTTLASEREAIFRTHAEGIAAEYVRLTEEADRAK